MQPVVQTTTRIPGPSTADPVVNECRKPTSPEARALRTSVSGSPLPSSTRSSKGLFASRGVWVPTEVSGMAPSAVEGPVDHVHLLLAREPHEIHRVPRHADREVRVLLRMLHRVEQRIAV